MNRSKTPLIIGVVVAVLAVIVLVVLFTGTPQNDTVGAPTTTTPGFATDVGDAFGDAADATADAASDAWDATTDAAEDAADATAEAVDNVTN